MFDISLNHDDIYITSVESKDIAFLENWFKHIEDTSLEKPLNIGEIFERFLESYVSESEFFLKIHKEGKFIGILKGRLEFKNPNEVWIWSFILDKNYRGKGIGSKILSLIFDHFSNNYGINHFFTGEMAKNRGALQFWRKQGFDLQRVVKDFFQINGENLDMMILQKEV